MKKPSIIFDLDGTLWDASRAIAKGWNDILPDRDPQLTPDDIRSVAGLPMVDIFKRLDIPFEEKIYHDLIEAEHLAINDMGALLFDGVRETIEQLKTCYDLYIVSNCQQGYIELFLTKMKMTDNFLDHLCWGDTLLPKGQTIRRLMERHNIQSAVYIGDTRGDQRAAQEAGIPFIFVNYGYGEADEPVERIDAFGQLLEVFPCR